MPSFSTILFATSSILSIVSASPILVERATCGSAPASTTAQTPLAQPAGINTAALCKAQCDAMTACQSFVFGMVNNVNDCFLYSVAAANVPTQTSTNLIVYDKTCTSAQIPTQTPTSSNPTGANNGGNTGTNTGANTGTNTGNNAGNQAGANKGNAPKLAVRASCGAAPSGPAGKASPISTPANISTVDACKAQCQASSSCKSFEFGAMTQGGAQVCRLFSVAASSVPAPTTGQSFVVYDVSCSI